MSGNDINKIDNLSKLKNLKILDLSKTKIKTI